MQPDAHGLGHSASHSHVHAGAPGGIIGAAVLATLFLVVAELVGGYLGHSIALISDALHNLTDIPTLLISWIALRWAARPADQERTYGYQRAGILAAFTNGILLVVVALYLFWEALQRLRNPAEVHEGWMIVMSVFALCINAGITLALVRRRHDLNLRSLVLHNFGDALSNIGILGAAVGIRMTGATWLDPAIGLVIAALVLWSTKELLHDAGHILLEGSPRGIRPDAVVSAILEVEGVQEVHDMHVWTIGSNLHALSCHIRIPDMHMDESERILNAIRSRLAESFHITHTTIQFERALPLQSGLLMPEPVKPAE